MITAVKSACVLGRILAIFIVVFLITGLRVAHAQDVMTPKVGTELRKLILNAVRIPVRCQLGLEVLFKVIDLRTDGEWSFLHARPLTPDYKPIHYSLTPFANEAREGVLEDRLFALVRNEPGEGWRVVELSIGATDAPFIDWPQKFGAPIGILP